MRPLGEILAAQLGAFAEQRKIMHLCESPIEQILCMSLASLGYLCRRGQFKPEMVAKMLAAKEAGAWLFAQQEIGKYRADFLLVAVARPNLVNRIVVEADGREFHHGNAEAMARDAERDAYLRQEGYRVARLTGSEIVRQNLAVVEERVVMMMEPWLRWKLGKESVAIARETGAPPERAAEREDDGADDVEPAEGWP